jgi:hypothetical protein
MTIMNRPSRTLSVFLVATLTITSTQTAPHAQGQNCAQIVDSFDARVTQAHSQLEQGSIGMVHSQTFANQVDSLRTVAGNDARLENRIDYAEKAEKALEKYNKLQGYQEAFNDIVLCLQPGSACTLTSLRERLVDEVRKWLDAKVGDRGGLNAVRERAIEAMNLIQRATSSALGITTDTMSAMQECTTAFRQPPRVDPTTGQPVTPSPTQLGADGLPVVEEPPSKPVENGGGMGAGMIATIGAIGAGAYAASLFTGGGANCQQPSTNFFTVCSSQGGSSQACASARAEQSAYCSCLGMRFSTSGGCVP